MALPDGFDLDEFVTRVLAEDLGKGGDVTSTATIDADARFTAAMNARQSMVVAGIEIAAACETIVEPEANLHRPQTAMDGLLAFEGQSQKLAGSLR